MNNTAMRIGNAVVRVKNICHALYLEAQDKTEVRICHENGTVLGTNTFFTVYIKGDKLNEIMGAINFEE